MGWRRNRTSAQHERIFLRHSPRVSEIHHRHTRLQLDASEQTLLPAQETEMHTDARSERFECCGNGQCWLSMPPRNHETKHAPSFGSGYLPWIFGDWHRVPKTQSRGRRPGFAGSLGSSRAWRSSGTRSCQGTHAGLVSQGSGHHTAAVHVAGSCLVQQDARPEADGLLRLEPAVHVWRCCCQGATVRLGQVRAQM